MSELRATTISDLAGTGPVALTKQSAAKTWVNFDGSGTVSIRDSINISSLTDNGTGQYTLGFTNSFTDTNYSPAALNGTSNGSSATFPQETYSAAVGSIRGITLGSNATLQDGTKTFFQAWGYLA